MPIQNSTWFSIDPKIIKVGAILYCKGIKFEQTHITT